MGRIAEDLAVAGHRVVKFWRASAEWQGADAPPRWRQPALLWNNHRVLDDLQRLHEAERPHLWLLHNIVPVVSLGVYARARRLGVPIVQWLHNYRPVSPGGALFAGPTPLRPEDPWRLAKECWAGSWRGRIATTWLTLGYARLRRRGDFNAVKAWVAVSDEMKNLFARAGWFPDKLFAVRHSWHWPADKISATDTGHFLFLGRMVEPKGVRFLLDLWRRPELRDTQLVMAGNGPLADELRSHTPPNVRWAGHVSGTAKRELIAGCRAIVFPCLWNEPLSTVAYEAAALGKPVLASDLGGMKEIIRDGQTGRLLPAGDADAWLQALQEMNTTTARRLGSAARNWLEETVSPAVWNRQFAVIAQRVLDAAA